MKEFKLVCPKCDYPYYCGCSSCISKVPDGMKPHTRTEDGEAVVCPNCGFVGSDDYWLDEEMRQLDEYEKLNGIKSWRDKYAD